MAFMQALQPSTVPGYHIWWDGQTRRWRWAFHAWTKQDSYGVPTHGFADTPEQANAACATNRNTREQVTRELEL